MRKLLPLCWALALMIGCSSGPGPAPAPAQPEKPKEPELATGRFAFQRLYISARGWARDAQPFRLQSTPTAEATGQDGKSSIWRASYASATQRTVKPYIWSGSDAPDAPARGINPGPEDSYSPNNASTQVFDMNFLKIDSDKALAVAQEHGGAKLLEKTPDLRVAYTLDWNRSNNKLIWHVYYGGDIDSRLRVSVDATSGEFVRVEK